MQSSFNKTSCRQKETNLVISCTQQDEKEENNPIERLIHFKLQETNFIAKNYLTASVSVGLTSWYFLGLNYN